MEPIDRFLTEIKNKVISCDYGGLRDDMVRDQLVLGVNDSKLQERLLRESELTLAKAEQMCYSSEAVLKQMSSLSTTRKDNDVAVAKKMH